MSHSTLQIPGPVAAAPAVALRDVRKVHGQGDAAVLALDGITIGLSRRSFTAITATSSSMAKPWI